MNENSKEAESPMKEAESFGIEAQEVDSDFMEKYEEFVLAINEYKNSVEQADGNPYFMERSFSYVLEQLNMHLNISKVIQVRYESALRRKLEMFKEEEEERKREQEEWEREQEEREKGE